MKIASILENQKTEKRVAITPEIAKKYISLGFEVTISENYGSHLGISDEEYNKLGVSTSNDEKDIIINADIIVQLGLLSDNKNIAIKTITPITATVPHNTNFVKLFQVFLWSSLSIKITSVLL